MATQAETTLAYRYNYSVPYSCDVGDIIRLYADFTDVDGQLIDPDSLTVRVKKPDKTTDSYLYPGEVNRIERGRFFLDVDVTMSGTWMYRWEAIGAGQSAAERTFCARESYF